MRSLVTGATGFVGSAVVRRLLAAEHHVRVLVRPASDRQNVEGLDVEVVEGDLTDANSLRAALEGCRYLFHVAALYRLWHPRPAEIYRANVEGTRHVLEQALAAGVERVVYTSSVATLGSRADGQPADEDTPVTIDDMIGHYKRSKFLAEREALRFVREEGLPVVVVNPAAPVGPRDIKPTPTGRMIQDAAAGRMPAYVDTGLDVVHVDDVAEGHVLALRRGRVGERYVLGGENMTLAAILGEVARITGGRPPAIRLSPSWLLPAAHLAQGWARLRGGREPRLTVDGLRLARKTMFFSSAKARRDLGYAPRPAHDALEDAVAWFRSRAPLT